MPMSPVRLPALLLPLVVLLELLASARPVLAAPAQRATFTAAVSPATARPGEIVTVTVTATIQPSWYIYSAVPVPPPGPVPTTLTIKAGALDPVGKTTESAPKRKNDVAFQKEVGYHEGTATFTQRLVVPSDAVPTAKLPVRITVGFMACNENVCLPPRDVEVSATLAIESGPVRPEYTGSEPATPTAAAGTTGDVTDAGSTGGSEGLIPFLLAAFGGGLLALVTPCVFPMVPVTLAFFTKQATAKGDGNARAMQGAVVRLAATYSLGIVLAFTGIGAVLAATVGAAGANQLAANPWVNLAFTTLFVLFALSLLEVVELRLPASLQRLAVGGRGHSGTLGVLGMGLTFVIAAFTCTAPIMGTVLVAASQASSGGQWVRPILGMAVFATALALPFFLLALFPGWLARLPKSGAWLSTVKGTMGFIELAAALKFLSNVDVVWNWQVLTTPVLLALWAIIALAASLWLLGILRVGFGTPEGRPSLRRAVWSAAFGALALYFLYGLTGRPLNGWVAALLPPEGYGIGQSQMAEGDGLVWHETLEAGLAEAKAQNRPVLIDFTGYACTNCRLMEKNVFPKPAVRAEMEKFIRIRLYTDGQDEESKKNQAYQENTFGDVALPLYAVLTPQGAPVSRIAGIRKPAEFASFLQKGEQQARGAEGTATASAR